MRTIDYNIAIDGPAGAGKSTIAKRIADELGLEYIDTGAMYRTIALLALENEKNDPREVAQIANEISIDLDGTRIYANGRDVTDKIRNIDVTKKVSEISKIPQVRRLMTKLQRGIAQSKGSILDGRDIGTVVLPDAKYKFFITADIEVRANRRFEELRAKGIMVDYSQVKEDILSRDREDLYRIYSPLKKAKDAVVIDTTKLSIEDAVNKIIQYVK